MMASSPRQLPLIPTLSSVLQCYQQGIPEDKGTAWVKVPFFTDGAPDSSAGQRQPFNPPLKYPHGSAELFLQK